MAKKKKEIKFGTEVEQYVADLIFDEYTISKNNKKLEDSDFEAIIDLLECKRTEKNYDWMSDVFLPEYPSIFNTEASQWANQYFQSRDFVDLYLEGDQPNDMKKCAAGKKLLNKTLNRRDLFHYHKYMRARSINSLAGSVYLVCGWNQEIKHEQVGVKKIPYALDVDVYGNQITDPNTQRPAMAFREEPEIKKFVIKDQFEYDVYDPRNVFTDNKYVYSIQDKDWITFRDEVTYDQLKSQEDDFNYFNLDLVKEMQSMSETETSKESYNKSKQFNRSQKSLIKPLDRLTRYGKVWATIEEQDKDGNPTKIKPGYDELGAIKEKAELVKAVIVEIISGSHKVIIRFDPILFRDTSGNQYYPVIRGLCYIHPTQDIGMSDGKYSREMQVAINDTINISNDRVKLATLPVFKGKKYSIEDNDQIYIEPEHTIPLEDINDLQELQIRDNIGGALSQAQLFISKLQQVNSVYPTTMGDVPGISSTTATAVAGAESRSNLRANYKSLTFEYTLLTELYWMIMQMTWQFMTAETAEKIFGNDVMFFDPDGDYIYKPVSSNIEMEYNKNKKISSYDQMTGRLAGLAKVTPAIIPIIAHIVGRQMELMGDEYQVIAGMVDKLANTPPNPEQGANQTADQGEMISNQSGMPQSGQEQAVREQMMQQPGTQPGMPMPR